MRSMSGFQVLVFRPSDIHEIESNYNQTPLLWLMTTTPPNVTDPENRFDNQRSMGPQSDPVRGWADIPWVSIVSQTLKGPCVCLEGGFAKKIILAHNVSRKQWSCINEPLVYVQYKLLNACSLQYGSNKGDMGEDVQSVSQVGDSGGAANLVLLPRGWDR